MRAQITKERIQVLNEIGFEWRVKTGRVKTGQDCETKQALLRQFKEHQGQGERFCDSEEFGAQGDNGEDDTLEDDGVEWKAQFEQYAKYKQGDRGDALREWVELQQAEYRLFLNGKATNLKLEQMELLNSIQFDWGTE